MKAIAGYLGVHHATGYRTLERWKQGGRRTDLRASPGVRKVDFAAVEAIRKLAQNPGLGAFRVHAAFKQMGFDLSRATCGRILAQIREVYGYEKPGFASGGGSKRVMPFAAPERHQVWSAEVRHLDMVDEDLVGSKVYAVTVMDNYSWAILSSAVTRRQDLFAFLSVFYGAVERHGAPGARHRLRLGLPRQPDEDSLCKAGRKQGGDREGKVVAEFLGNDVRYSAAHGRLALLTGTDSGTCRGSVMEDELSLDEVWEYWNAFEESLLLMGEVLPLMSLATEIAVHSGCIIYGALFVTLAESEDTVVVTADEKLLKAVEGTPYAKWGVHLEDALNVLQLT